MRYGWSIRTRLTLISSAVMAVLCVSASIATIFALRDMATSYRTERTASTALKIVHTIKRGALPKALPADLTEGLDAAQVVDARGRVVAGSGTLGDEQRIAQIEPPDDSARIDEERCDLPVVRSCEIVVTFRVYEADGDWFVYALDQPVPWYVSGRLAGILAGTSLLLVALTAIGANRTVSRALKPVEDIRARAMEIGAGVLSDTLSERLPLPKHHDELYTLTVSANGVLERLEKTIQRERRFSADASHDLRSPIAAMRAQLDEAMMYPGDTDWKDTSLRLSTSLDRLSAIVEDLLTLARLDAHAEPATEAVALDALIRTEAARRRQRVPIGLELQPVAVEGNRLQLARLLTNLLDNAQRHADAEVTVRLRAEGGEAVLEVINDGDSIPPQLREAVFRRFARLDASRSKDTGGTGLGLAIVREIAAAHGGTVVVADSERGARFVVRLPLPAQRT
ncbi:HAMP domain-containing sensor histidine kinase [Actinocorallia lasiicapitis]